MMQIERRTIGNIDSDSLKDALEELQEEGFLKITHFTATNQISLNFVDGKYSVENKTVYHLIMEKTVTE